MLNWDTRTSEGWGHLVENCQAIINLTGENIAGSGLLPTRWSQQQKQIILESRLHAGEAIVQAVQQAGNKSPVVVQASRVGYYWPKC